MQAIRCKDTSIELLLRKELWRRGLRYRTNYKQLPGKPDIVFTKHRIAIFCDSEFWHGYDWENTKNSIKTNSEFWVTKIERNISRDEEVNNLLTDLGWKVIRIWGKDIKKDPSGCADYIQDVINGQKNRQVDK